MDLTRALRLEAGSPVAFVGAGGKSSAMFVCARLLPAPVIVTTTTHLAESQLQQADASFVIRSIADLPADLMDRGHVVAVVGPPVKNWRVSGLSFEILEQINERLAANGGTMLVEADGSRMLPLKAPADFEPAIPGFVASVVVTAGLSGLGKPLDEATIHRVERYAGLSGLQLGDPISISALAAVLAHPQGGLKGIVAHQPRMLLLNQADTPELQSAGVSLSSILLGTYDGVIIASVQPGGQEGSSTRVYAAYQKTAAVIWLRGVRSAWVNPNSCWIGKVNLLCAPLQKPPLPRD
jgi:molybdenum cofactor cytidylyltransferase